MMIIILFVIALFLAEISDQLDRIIDASYEKDDEISPDKEK